MKLSKNTFLQKFQRADRVVRSKNVIQFWAAFDRHKKVSETDFWFSSLFFQQFMKTQIFMKITLLGVLELKTQISRKFEFSWANFEKIMKKFKNLFPRLFCAYRKLFKTLLNFWNGQLYLPAEILEERCFGRISQWDLAILPYSKVDTI